jgi:hypothetical protein
MPIRHTPDMLRDFLQNQAIINRLHSIGWAGE